MSIVLRFKPRVRGSKLASKSYDVTAQNKAFFYIDFYVIEILSMPVIIVNSNHAFEAYMVNDST